MPKDLMIPTCLKVAWNNQFLLQLLEIKCVGPEQNKEFLCIYSNY